MHRENSGSVRDFKARYIRTSGGSRGGAVWGNCTRKRLWCPVKAAPLRDKRPFLVSIEVETD